MACPASSHAVAAALRGKDYGARAADVIQRRVIDIFRAYPGETKALPALAEGYVFRRLADEDFAASPLGKRRFANFQMRLAKGHQAWGYVTRDGSLACYLWLSGPLVTSHPPDFECGLRAEIPSGAAYIWDCRSDTANEGRGLYRHGLVTLSAHAFQSGARDVLIVSRRENVRSRRSIEAAGFRRVVTLTCWRLLNLVAFAGMGMPGLKRAGSIIHLSYEA